MHLQRGRQEGPQRATQNPTGQDRQQHQGSLQRGVEGNQSCAKGAHDHLALASYIPDLSTERDRGSQSRERIGLGEYQRELSSVTQEPTAPSKMAWNVSSTGGMNGYTGQPRMRSSPAAQTGRKHRQSQPRGNSHIKPRPADDRPSLRLWHFDQHRVSQIFRTVPSKHRDPVGQLKDFIQVLGNEDYPAPPSRRSSSRSCTALAAAMSSSRAG